MADESTMIAAPETGSDSGGGVDQSALISDAFTDDNYFNSHAKELGTEKPQQAEPPKEQPKPAAETPKAGEKAPEKQAPQKSQFDQAFAGEDGEVDLDRFLEFSTSTLPESEAAAIADIGTPDAKAEPQLEQWQQDQKQVEALQTQLTNELLAPLDKAYELIKQGVDPVQALKSAYDERKAHADKQVNELKTKLEFQRQKSLREELLSGTKAEAEKKQSAINTNEIVSSLPGKNLKEKSAIFNEIMFGKDVGAIIMNREFNRAVPGNEKMAPAARAAAAQKFVDSVTSNKAELRYLFNQARALMTQSSLPKILQKARMSAVGADRTNRLAAQSKPLGTQRRVAPKAGSDPWAGYFSSHEQTADRV